MPADAVQPAPTAESYVAEGDAFAHSRQFDNATDAYRQALRINPALAVAYNGLGDVPQPGAAGRRIEPLTAAARLDPQHAIVLSLREGMQKESARAAQVAAV